MTSEELRQHLKSKSFVPKPWKNVDTTLPCVLMVGKGWLFGTLTQMDALLWGRWSYWIAAWASMKAPEEPIPQIVFETQPNALVVKMLENTLECCFQGRTSRYRQLEWLVQWLRWSLGSSVEKPANPNPDIPSDKIAYQVFCLELLQLYPFDYWGHLLSKAGHGKNGAAFYPTPMGITELMQQMLSGGKDADTTASTMDPAVGTGRTLLSASNHTLYLFGQDLDPLVLACLDVNFALYAPWGYRPLPSKYSE